MGKDTWRQVHWWAGVVTWSWEAHVGRDGRTWSHRSTNTRWQRHRPKVMRWRGTEVWRWWTPRINNMSRAWPGVEHMSVGRSGSKISTHWSRQGHTWVPVGWKWRTWRTMRTWWEVVGAGSWRSVRSRRWQTAVGSRREELLMWSRAGWRSLDHGAW